MHQVKESNILIKRKREIQIQYLTLPAAIIV